MISLYEILGVKRGASQQEIRAAYRKLALLYHPDVNPSASATDDFVRISEAYQILTDHRLRSLYDRGLLRNKAEAIRQELERQMMEKQFDDFLNEVLRKDYEETMARRVAVTTVVALFFSTFLMAFVRPPIFEAFGLVGRLVCVVLFCMGVRELVKNIKFSLRYYTFDDERTISVMDPDEPPQKPFTRMEAWAFLMGGYLAALGIGIFVRYVIGESRFLGESNLFLSIFLVPPIFVFLVSRLQRLRPFRTA